MKKLAIHLHLFYLDQLSEILKYLDSLKSVDYDLFVTMIKKNNQIEQQIKSFDRNAKIWIVPNRGYDVGPFIYFLHNIDLNCYDYILKIHTKSENTENITYLNKYCLNNKIWRQILLDGLLKNSCRVQNNLYKFDKNGDIGMLSSKYCLTSDRETYLKLLPQINKELENLGFQKVHIVQFVAGTMFYVKAKLLKPFLQYKLNDFSQTDSTIKDGTLAHVLERVFCIVVNQKGFKICGIDHDNYKCKFFILSWKNFISLWKNFIYRKKITSRGYLIIKILKLPIYHRKVF